MTSDVVLADEKLYTVEECLQLDLECFCMRPSGLDKVSRAVLDLRVCKGELELSEKWIEKHSKDAIKTPWHKSGFITAALISAGFFLGFVVGSK